MCTYYIHRGLPWVKPVAGPDRPDMESYSGPKSSATREFVIMGSDLGFAIMICQLAPIATQCAAFGMASQLTVP